MVFSFVSRCSLLTADSLHPVYHVWRSYSLGQGFVKDKWNWALLSILLATFGLARHLQNLIPKCQLCRTSEALVRGHWRNMAVVFLITQGPLKGSDQESTEENKFSWLFWGLFPLPQYLVYNAVACFFLAPGKYFLGDVLEIWVLSKHKLGGEQGVECANKTRMREKNGGEGELNRRNILLVVRTLKILQGCFVMFSESPRSSNLFHAMESKFSSNWSAYQCSH